MSVEREENTCTITFDSADWRTEAEDVFTVTDGAVPFYEDTTWSYDEKPTLRSGQIDHNGVSETTITVIYEEDGTLSLGYIVSSETGYDFFRILVDGVEKVKASGIDTDFKEYEQELEAGTHTITFRYTKDVSNVRGSDAGAIGYIRFTGVAVPFDIRYLLTDFENKVYTVVDGEVTELPALSRSDLTSKIVFLGNGFPRKPTEEMLSKLTRPSVFRWSLEQMKHMKAEVTATPKAQKIEAVADLHHETILGIAGMTAVYQGDITASYSYDKKTYTDAVSMEEFLQTDPAALYAGAADKMIYFRFVIAEKSSSFTNFVITYINP